MSCFVGALIVLRGVATTVARVNTGGCPLDFPALPLLRAVASSVVYASVAGVGHAGG